MGRWEEYWTVEGIWDGRRARSLASVTSLVCFAFLAGVTFSLVGVSCLGRRCFLGRSYFLNRCYFFGHALLPW